MHYLVEVLRTEMTFTFPHSMEHLQKCESPPPAPFLMTQVPDFKFFVQGYICDGQDAPVGHSTSQTSQLIQYVALYNARFNAFTSIISKALNNVNV